MWNFARRSTAVELTRTRGDTAAMHLELVQTRLGFLTIDDFYAVLSLRRSLEVQDEQIDALNQHLAVIQERVRTGVATDFDVLTTQVRVATARGVRIDVANQLDRAAIELRQLLGLPEGTRSRSRATSRWRRSGWTATPRGAGRRSAWDSRLECKTATCRTWNG